VVQQIRRTGCRHPRFHLHGMAMVDWPVSSIHLHL
jgi:hypothetical protein